MNFRSIRRGLVLEFLPGMLVSFAVAAAVLSSSTPLTLVQQLPKGAFFQVIAPAEAPARTTLPSAPPTPEAPPAEFLRGWLGQLAVVKPHRSAHDAPPSMQMFVLVAPVKGVVGVHAVGSF
jgi:hypothetical protein